ncbi:acyl carrier protein [Streptomyces lincolnensis]|uniref:acyl carrier protein n=1 Tax=Streptomyces lincolnensis TaxID=1915 RepID=UPI0037CFF2B4
MSGITRQDLRRILEGPGNEADAAVWEAAGILDTPFSDLGFDSLALLEMAVRIEQEYTVAVPEETVENLATPRAVLDFVNRRLAEA